MKTVNILGTMLLMTTLLGSVTFASCSDDDDDTPKTTTLKFSKASVNVMVGKTDTLKVTNGTQPFTAKSGSEAIAKVTTKADSIFVTGVKTGTVAIVVTDNNKNTGRLAATVKKVATTLKFSKTSVEVAAGKTETLKVTNGTQPFTVKSSDASIATVKVDKDEITVTGVKAGSVSIVVTDKDKNTGSVPVKVK